MEPRERTEGNTGEQHTCRTLRRVSVSQRLACVREAASWDSSLITQGGSPVRESRPPGSVRAHPANGCPYRDRCTKDLFGTEGSKSASRNSFIGVPRCKGLGVQRFGSACYQVHR